MNNDSTNDLKNNIKNKLINPDYFNNIKQDLDTRTKWKNIGNFFDTLSHLLTSIATILAFANSGFPEYIVLSFISGCVGVCALAVAKFSSYALNRSSINTNEINKILYKLGMDSIVDININDPVSDLPNNTKQDLNNIIIDNK